ncbi:hypothetical protein AB0E04_06965 [Streptomyces sp. NPDC048251]|uniref:hypothetical protein n=1 Tax=Streptomyces sp. NPDC048251 TaxID=3154501 RepID=UPI00341F9D1B
MDSSTVQNRSGTATAPSSTRYRDGHVLLRSRRGTDMTPAFPEIRATAAQLPDDDTALDGGV